LTSKRKVGLTFSKADIPLKMYLQLVQKASMITCLAFKFRKFSLISPTVFE
jgi:hypothetical protein